MDLIIMLSMRSNLAGRLQVTAHKPQTNNPLIADSLIFLCVVDTANANDIIDIPVLLISSLLINLKPKVRNRIDPYVNFLL